MRLSAQSFPASSTDLFWLRVFFNVTATPVCRSTQTVTLHADEHNVDVVYSRMTYTIGTDSLPFLAAFCMTVMLASPFVEISSLPIFKTVCVMFVIVPLQFLMFAIFRCTSATVMSGISPVALQKILQTRSISMGNSHTNFESRTLICQYVVLLDIFVYLVGVFFSILTNRHILVVLFFKCFVFNLVPLLVEAADTNDEIYFQDAILIEILRSFLLCLPIVYLGSYPHEWWMIHFVFFDFLETTFDTREVRAAFNENLS